MFVIFFLWSQSTKTEQMLIIDSALYHCSLCQLLIPYKCLVLVKQLKHFHLIKQLL